jgi:hypothetical protein
MTDNQETHDSTTNVDKRKTRFSDKLTVRCDPESKKAFLGFCKETGLSECQILDSLIKAMLHGVTLQKPLVDKSPTINLSIERVVARPRRVVREVEEVDTTRKKKETNHYRDGAWFFDPELEAGEIVVEQPREWGKNRCAEGFIWVEGRQAWWKKV